MNSAEEAQIPEENSVSSHGNHANVSPMMAFSNIHQPILHQAVTQPSHPTINSVGSHQKIGKRPQSMNFNYPDIEQKVPMRQNVQLSYNPLSQHPAVWDPSLNPNFVSMANNSLQMTHYLK